MVRHRRVRPMSRTVGQTFLIFTDLSHNGHSISVLFPAPVRHPEVSSRCFGRDGR